MNIRKYEDRDLGGLMAAWEGASQLAHPFMSEEFFEQERHNIPNIYLPNAETWVAEQDGKVTGFIALIGDEIGGLFVAPAFHGTGIGRALTDKARQLHGNLEVEVFEANDIGCGFYAKYGFEPLSESVHDQSGHKLLRLKYTSE